MSSKGREVSQPLGQSPTTPNGYGAPPPPHPPPPAGGAPWNSQGGPSIMTQGGASIMTQGGASIMTAPQPEMFHQDATYWKTAPLESGAALVSGVHPGVRPQPPKAKSVLEAYVLCLPLGFLGAHHFYLGRPCFGILYFLSFGLLGVGWLIDMFRMPCLVSSVNKKNREKHQQLLALQDQLARQRQNPHPGQVVPCNVVFVPFEPRSLADAYILWFPFGLLGFHHFYLRNYGWGFLYFFTFGLLGIGWLIDACRLPYLVKEANTISPISPFKQYNQCTAHVLALSPAGILGGHHYYLDRPIWGLLYTFTFGLCGAGWLWDWCRVWVLVERANKKCRGLVPPDRKYVDEAYALAFPWGFTGLHHFYLQRYGWGCLYFFTFGIMGIGWLVDLFRMPCLVKETNIAIEESSRRLLLHTHTDPTLTTVTVTTSTNGTTNPNPTYTGPQNGVWNPAFSAGYYPPAAGYGYQAGYSQAPVAYPGMTGFAQGPYPSYMTQGAGGVVYPPQYSAPPTSNGTTGQSAGQDVPPSYEASLGADTKRQQQ